MSDLTPQPREAPTPGPSPLRGRGEQATRLPSPSQGGGAGGGGFRRAADKIVTLDGLVAALGPRRAAGQRVAFTNGAFDLVHVGHLRSLEQARAQADLLVVAVNSDVSVRSYKAPGRPIVPQAERAELIAGLACVDYVVVFDEPTAERLIVEVRPDVYVKGADYAAKPLPERPLVEAYGGRVVLIELEAGRSTSGLVDEIVRRFGSAHPDDVEGF